MFNKINIIEICHNHIATLCDAKSGEIAKTDLFLFFGLPFVVAFVLTAFVSPVINGELQAIFATIFSIFTALLLSLLVLLYTMSSSQSVSIQIDDEETKKVFHEVLNETLSSISFLILISIMSLATIILLAVFNYATSTPLLDWLCDIFYISNPLSILMPLKNIFLVFLSFVSYSLVGIFLVTILMVLKRVMLLLDTLLPKSEGDSN